MPERDVIIVGAGFTGLVAASQLADAGLDVLLLEARSRVGGKVESTVLTNGRRVDTGGQFFCRDMPQLMALIEAHGTMPMMSYADGDTVFRPPVSPAEGLALWHRVDALREQMIATDPHDPELAGLTVAAWIARQDIPANVAQGFLRLVKGLWCRSPEEISFAYLASNDRRITNTHWELEMFLAETMHWLAERIAANLDHRLRLDARVTHVDHSPGGVTVGVEQELFSARRLILALPPTISRRLSFSPALSDALGRALAAWGAGNAIKVHVTYARPFWRVDALNGSVMWQEPQGLYACDASHGDHAGLVVFIGGPLADDWHRKSNGELRTFILGLLVDAFGPEAGQPQEVHIRDWVADPWSGGAYSDVIVELDAADAEDVLNHGAPPVYFASSELSPSFPGYIEGAIVAGKQVAARVFSDVRQGVATPWQE
ncbi:flavin monoamine oxidase family protein [Neorhizobium alkalisoli]|uniref:flavin monoamine oxidase family protein n=1 Tax=Neorhizobium alkalisoli TaxID=528178 RepID=UPI000CF9ECB3|nr:FAD-dependent oxidoreductase [Neorhizobium alkalisoli]